MLIIGETRWVCKQSLYYLYNLSVNVKLFQEKKIFLKASPVTEYNKSIFRNYLFRALKEAIKDKVFPGEKLYYIDFN